MSWLLVALIPGLLMLATFGLDRLEASLDREPTPTPAKTPRRTLTPAIGSGSTDTWADDYESDDEPRRWALTSELEIDRLPTRTYAQHGMNPQFQATRHADRV